MYHNPDILTSSFVRIIKEKIGKRILHVNDSDNALFYNQKKIISLSSEMLVFDDGSSLHWDQTTSLHDLVSVLIWVEDYLKIEEQNWISIKWSIYDFEEVAQQKEKDENLEVGAIYDRSKFGDALRLLEKNHDCNYGITWNDIDHYLDEYCIR
jgi:hypothetical protein